MQTWRARRTARLITPLVALFLVAAALPLQSDDPNPAGALVAYSLAHGRQVWSARTPGMFTLLDVSDALVAGRAFDCGSSGSRMIAKRTGVGAAAWTAPSDFDSFPAFGADTLATGANRSGVVVVTDATNVYAVDARTGERRWNHRYRQIPSVLADANTVYVATTRGRFDVDLVGRVTAYDRRTGRKLWTRSRSDWVAVPFPGAGITLVSFTDVDGTTSGSVAVNAKTGRTQWSSPLASMGVSGDVALLVSNSGDPEPRLEGHDTRTGALMWTRPLPYRAVRPLGPRFAVMTGPDSWVMADARTGEDLYPLDAVSLPGLIGVGGDALAGVDRTTLHLADATTGRERWSAPLPPGFEAVHSVTIGKNAVYLSVGCYPMD